MPCPYFLVIIPMLTSDVYPVPGVQIKTANCIPKAESSSLLLFNPFMSVMQREKGNTKQKGSMSKKIMN
jgi:hypothetical protein